MSKAHEQEWSEEFLDALADPTPRRLMRVIRAISTRPDLWQPERTIVQMAQQSIRAFDAMARALAARAYEPPAAGEGDALRVLDDDTTAGT